MHFMKIFWKQTYRLIAKKKLFFLDSSLGFPTKKNNFRVTKKFLITKFDCTALPCIIINFIFEFCLVQIVTTPIDTS